MRQLKIADYVNSIGAQNRTKKGPKERVRETKKERYESGNNFLNRYLMDLMRPIY